MIDETQNLDYNMLLLNHINRLSSLTTSNFFDSYDKSMLELVKNPHSIGESSLKAGIIFFHCLIPDSLKDSDYIEQTKNLDFDKDQYVYFRALVNLLDRKGILRSNPISFKKIKQGVHK